MSRLKELRGLKNYTQEDVAQYMGITRAAYSNIENGKRQRDEQTIRQLSELYNVSAGCVLGMEPIPTANKNQPLAEGEELKYTISQEDSDKLFDSFVQAGLISDNESMSESDRAFFHHIIGLFDAWMRNKRT